MNIIQQNFRRNHKIFISALVILIISCMLPSTVFAAQTGEYTPTYDSNGTQGRDIIGNGGGWNPRKYNVHQSTSGLWYGYRMYIVDDQGNLMGSGRNYYTMDIYTRNMFDNDSVIKGTTLRINNSNVTLSSIPKVSISDINNLSGKVGNLPCPTNGDRVNGDALRAWMDTENTNKGENGVAYNYNVNWLVMALWGDSALTTYMENDDYSLVVESLYECYLWTDYKPVAKNAGHYNYVPVTEDRENFTHLMYYIGDAGASTCRAGGKHEIDICLGCTHLDDYGQDYYKCRKCGARVIYEDSALDAQLGPWDKIYGLEDLLSYIGSNRNQISMYPKSITVQVVIDSQLQTDFYHNPNCESCVGLDICGVVRSSDGTKIKECTNQLYWDTYYGWLKMNSTGMTITSSITGKVRNVSGYANTYIYIGGNALTLSNDASLGLIEAGDNCKDLTLGTLGNIGYGIHLYKSSNYVVGNPIHTINPVDPTPSDTKDPITPEEPKKEVPPAEPFDSTGDCTIIKVYGDIYEEDNKIYHIKDKVTYKETNTTNKIIIEDEEEYKLVEWRTASTTNNNITASKWKYINDDKQLKTRGKTSLGFTTIMTRTKANSDFLSTEEEPREIGEGNTIYLLYIRELPPLETSKTTDNTDDIPDTPKPTNIENPYNPDNPKKQGSYKVVKVYGILDKYNGSVIHQHTNTRESTTPFINIPKF